MTACSTDDRSTMQDQAIAAKMCKVMQFIEGSEASELM